VTSGSYDNTSAVIQITVTNCDVFKSANINNNNMDSSLDTTPLVAYAIRNIEILIKGDVSGGAVATLYDMAGRVVRTKILEEGSTNSLPTPGIKTAIYILHVNDHGKMQTFKIPVRE
jgi:hypothetical protein